MRNASRLPFGTIDRYPPKIEGSLSSFIKKTVNWRAEEQEKLHTLVYSQSHTILAWFFIVPMA